MYIDTLLESDRKNVFRSIIVMMLEDDAVLASHCISAHALSDARTKLCSLSAVATLRA